MECLHWVQGFGVLLIYPRTALSCGAACMRGQCLKTGISLTLTMAEGCNEDLDAVHTRPQSIQISRLGTRQSIGL